MAADKEGFLRARLTTREFEYRVSEEFGKCVLVLHHDQATKDGFCLAMHTVLSRYSSASSA